ncbi:hypothetical protein PMM47T1_08931 [Pseudomonas sp. M47T1]|uniref:glycosyltransferase family 2 protein n=1 Tax=Pseudomonas sp. M47T1 TaxID=1179778 RepID=UPI0002607FF2|nr:glycosyltransferase [Pseudomonas sp. M47T1]EIK97254.1 hypothetical protein PMM47T1_08931 [Pseudomonas sp. M47T1]
MNRFDTSTALTPSFSIALVNYKTLDITRICLELLHTHLAHSNIQVWVVDNDSADASTHYLRSLDWINLIERVPAPSEPGHVAHGKALDLVLERVDSDYLFLLHTDTFIFDPCVFERMLQACTRQPGTCAVGCVEQINRGLARTVWRGVSRHCKHYYRRLLRSAGLPARLPKPCREVYLKSFCALWDCRLIKQHGLRFCLDDRVPGYTLQDRLTTLGHDVVRLAPGRIFRYLDHIQSGTVAAAGGYGASHRRTKMYNQILKRLNAHA